MGFARYVALGDSQTEGLNDSDGRGGFRGWADRLAEILTVPNPHLQYANLAVRGRRMPAIRAEQLEPALAMRPDLATVMGGLNDILASGFRLDRTLGELDAMVGALRSSGATVVTNTFPDIGAIAPLMRRLRPRVSDYNAGIREVAERHDALVVDFAAHAVGTDLRIWSPDRIHANSLGHSLIAAGFADTLGLAGFAAWSDPLPARSPEGALRRARTEARWIRTDVAPWLLRRARGRSSGDGLSAKRPRLVPVAPILHLVEPGQWPSTGRYRPPSLLAEGFVHFSFADQLAATANRIFADADELVAVEIDAVALDAPVVVEDSYGSGTAFPHVYGPIPVTAAVAVHRLERDGAGSWLPVPTVTAGRAAASSSLDR